MRARFLMRLGRNEPAAAGGTSTLEFSDDFNRADNGTVGNGWSEIDGAALTEIAGNVLNMSSGDDMNIVAQTGTPMSGVGQFIKVTPTVSATSFYAVLIFRYTDATSPSYTMWVSTGTGLAEWYRATDHDDVASMSAALVQDETFAWTSGTPIGITVMGTSTNVVVRWWLNPTGDSPDAGGTTWGGAGPTVTMSDNPGTPVDTGNIVGLGGYLDAAGTVTFNDFFAGTVS